MFLLLYFTKIELFVNKPNISKTTLASKFHKNYTLC